MSAIVEPGIDALAEQVQRQGHDIDIAGALAIAEQRALDPVGAGHHAELGRGDAGAAVVVRMQAEDRGCRGRGCCGRTIRSGRHRRWASPSRPSPGRLRIIFFSRRRLPDIHHRLADLDREVELGAGEALGRILVDDLGLRHRRGQLADQPGAGHRDVDDAGLVEPEDDAALQGRGRVVEMHDRAPGAADRLEGALDQLGARLRQHLDRHVVGDQVLLDELADKVEIGLRGGRESRPRSP